jgi:hypothetical protein
MRTALLRFTVALLVSALVEVQAGEAPSITVTPIDSSAIRPALPPGPLILPLEVDIVAARDFIRLGFGLDKKASTSVRRQPRSGRVLR